MFVPDSGPLLIPVPYLLVLGRNFVSTAADSRNSRSLVQLQSHEILGSEWVLQLLGLVRRP
jgi:hypothetical protein